MRRGHPRSRGCWRHLTAIPLLALAAAAGISTAHGKVFLSREEALELAFGAGATVERRTAYLSDEQLSQARRRAGSSVSIASALVPFYVGTRDGEPLGTAYFDTHVVRTEAETVMAVVDPQGKIRRVEVLSFDEPPDYLPRAAWLLQFQERRLDGELELNRAIRPMTGATLTAREITRAVRRILALHAVIAPLKAETEGAPAEAPR